MDPNEALKKTLELADRIGNRAGESALAYELAEYIEGLDHWITTGGFLPERWQKK